MLKNLLIESQRIDDILVFDSGERLREYVGELFVCRDVFDIECASFIMVSDEVISDIDVF